MAEMKVDRVLDAKGLLCPMPIIKTKLAIEKMAPGQVLKIIATDPASSRDLAVWCRETGNPLLHSTKEGGVFVFLIQKK